MVIFDLLIVLCTFILSLLQLFYLSVSPVSTAIVLLRVFQIIRASRVGRVMRHKQECSFEGKHCRACISPQSLTDFLLFPAKLGESEIELQMRKTLQSLASESTQKPMGMFSAHGSSANEFALRRARTVPSSPQVPKQKNFKFTTEEGEEFKIPLQTFTLRTDE